MTCVVYCPKAPEAASLNYVIYCDRSRHFPNHCPCGHSLHFLCDFPIGERGRTCDAQLCYCCRIHVGEDRDYCLPHATEAHAAPVAEASGVP